MIRPQVVPDFGTTQQLRGIFQLAARCLAPGGRLVFDAFLARQGYTPDNAARELAQQCYSMIFTWDEMTRAAELLPLEPMSSLPTTPSTSTRKPTCPKAPGRPPAGTPIGSAAWTSSTSSGEHARSTCTGSSTSSGVGTLGHRPSLHTSGQCPGVFQRHGQLWGYSARRLCSTPHGRRAVISLGRPPWVMRHAQSSSRAVAHGFSTRGLCGGRASWSTIKNFFSKI
jgi:hypothetical protein